MASGKKIAVSQEMPSPRPLGRWPILTHPVLVAIAIVVLLALLRLSWAVRDAFILGFLAITLAVLMSFPIRFLARFMPRGVATLLVLTSMAGAGILVFQAAAGPVSHELRKLNEQLPQAANRIDEWLMAIGRSEQVSPLPVTGPQVESRLRRHVTGAVEGLAAQLVPAAAGVLEGLSAGILLVVLAAFLAYQPDAYRTGLRLLIPRDWEAVFEETWRRLAAGIHNWLGGIAIAMVLMGTLTGLGLAAAGIEGWFLLGLLTFFATFVPYLGAIASAVPGLITGLAQSPRHFLAALAVYVGVHLVEGYVVEPVIMRRAVELNPALLLFWQLVMAGVFGIWGVVIATPALVCLKIIIGYLYVERTLGKRSLQPPRAASH